MGDATFERGSWDSLGQVGPRMVGSLRNGPHRVGVVTMMGSRTEQERTVWLQGPFTDPDWPQCPGDLVGGAAYYSSILNKDKHYEV